MDQARRVVPWILALSLAAQGTCQADLSKKAERSLKFANFMVERGDLESGGVAAREAYRAIESLSAVQLRDTAAKDLRKRILAVLNRIDRDGKRLVDEERKQATRMLRLSKNYRAKGWHKTAYGILGRAAHLAPDIVAVELQSVREKLRLNETEKLNLLEQWFGKGFTAFGNRRWTITAGGISSPVVSGKGSEMVVSNKKLSGDVRVTFDVRIPPTGFAGFSWSIKLPQRGSMRHYVLDVHPRSRQCTISRIHGSTVKVLGTCRIKKCEELGWVPVKLEFRGKTCSVGAGDMAEQLTIEMAKPLGGYIGLFVSGANELKDPVMYRRLVIEPLR